MVKKYKKYIWLLLLVFAVILPLATAHAVTSPEEKVVSGCSLLNFSFTDCILGTIFNGIGWLFLTVGAFFGMILAWAVSWILAFGQNIVNTPAVQGGFAVTLAIANLGFVLAVIIFAITTILRIQNYGGKKLLVNVVIAAVLVNFGLVLAGAALTFSDSVTNYFLDAVTGANSASGLDRYAAFRNKMFGAFQPEQLQIPNEEVLKANGTAQSMAGATTGKAETLSKTFISMLMSIIGIVLVIITLATFVIMLVIRYVWLVLLLVLLPLAWLAKVFPGLSGNFNTWWEKFLAQLLFPPAALFFLWLALMASKNTIALTGSDALPTAIQGSNPIGASFLGPLFNVVVLTFMMLGGLMAAQKLGSSFAAKGLAMANGAGKWAGKRAGRSAKRVASTPFQNKKVQDMAQTMMKSTTRGPLGYLGRLGGRGLAMAARPGGANQVADYEKQYAGLDKNRLLEELRADPLGHNKNSRAAILGLLSKQKGGLESLTSQEIDEVKKNKDTYEKIGAKSTSDAVLDATGTNAQVALEKIAALTEKLGAATEEEKGLLNTELSELRGTLQKSIGKMSPEILAGFFKKTDSDKNKNPLGMEGGEGGEFETFKASLAREMVGPQGATVSKFSSFISQLQEQGGGAEENFKNASKEVGSEDISEGIKKWLSNTGAANLGVSLESYYPGAASGKTAAGIKEQDEALKGVMSNTPDNEAAYEEAQKVRRENASKSKGLT